MAEARGLPVTWSLSTWLSLASERITGSAECGLNPLLESDTCSAQGRELRHTEPPSVLKRRQALDADRPGFERQLCRLSAPSVS